MDAGTWQLAEAKNKLSEVITRAVSEGPQRIRRRADTVVVISLADFERLGGNRSRPSLGRFLLDGPSLDGVNLERSPSEGREVRLDGPD